MKTTTVHRLFAATAVAVASLAGAPAQASLFSSVYFIGDSVSDSGNVALALAAGYNDPSLAFGVPQVISGNGYIPDAPYVQTPPQFGVFSNGPVWTQYFAQGLGGQAVPSLLGGNNYAFGGARTGGPDVPVPTLKTQTSMLLNALGPAGAPAGSLFVVASVGNDVRDALDGIGLAIANGADPGLATLLGAGAAAYNYASNVGWVVDQLQAAGAKDILVLNNANLGLTPALGAAPPGFAQIGTTVSAVMNGALAGRLQNEAGVEIFDTFAFFTGVVANPAALGFTNVSDACGAVAGADCSSYLFWDGIHPTTMGHQRLAQAVFAQAVPEPETYALMIFGLGFVGWMARRRAARA